MPIKFRCTHCRQFLGISRSKAGEIVDCPTCGRTLRVPNLDGTADPLPDPELNLKDSELAGALHELARIGQTPPAEVKEPERPAVAPTPVPRTIKTVQPAPAPEPIALDPLPPAEPVRRSEPKRRPASKPHVGRREPAAPSSRSPIDELATMAPSTAAGTDSWHGRWRPRLAALFPLPVLLTLGGAAALAFGVGYLVGHGAGGRAAAPSEQAAPSDPSNDDLDGTPWNSPRKTALRGQITYKTSGGHSRPDEGARVLVFPERRADGEVRLSVAGFRAGDRRADFNVALASLRALGGDLAIADGDGQYEVSLPKQGEYQVLVVSRYQPRGDDDSIKSAVQRLLEDYFEHPEALLGRLSYVEAKIRYNGERPETWNYTFERPL